MADLFLNDTDYEQWLMENPNGYVLNTTQGFSKKYAVLHSAKCKRISNSIYQSGAFTERDYRKICSMSQDDILNWVKNNIGINDFTTKCYCVER